MNNSNNKDLSQKTTTTSITVKVLFFASARDAVNGKSQMDIVLPCSNENDDYGNTIITSNSVRSYLIEQYPKLHIYIHADISSITMALNEEYIPHGVDLPIRHGDTIAIIPPISGG
jgi:molybdopterin converting factor small subunit